MDIKHLNPKVHRIVINGKYVLKERLGGGSFGQIYSATNVTGNGVSYAIKLEKRHMNGYTTLSKEAKVISDMKDAVGFPTLHDYGREEEYNYLAISLLGNNLEKLFKLCNFHFSLKTILMLANQMLSRIAALHQKGYLHRDIKPENFCMGIGHYRKAIFLIDFGLSSSYKDIEGKHIPLKENKGLVGTARYASINSHLGLELSRRDDLEEIGYTLIYLLKGSLPWQNLKAQSKSEKYMLIKEKKTTTSIERLCEGLPIEFSIYMKYVKGLGFADTPDYKYLKKLFKDLLIHSGFELDHQYDWLYYMSSATMKKENLLAPKPVPMGVNEEVRPDNTKKEPEPLSRDQVQINQLESGFDDAPRPDKAQLEGAKPNNLEEELSPKTRHIHKVVKIISQKLMDNIRPNETRLRSRSRHSRGDHCTTSYHSSKALNFTVAQGEDEVPTEGSFENNPGNKIEHTIPIVAKRKDFSQGNSCNNLQFGGSAVWNQTREDLINNKKNSTLPAIKSVMCLQNEEEKDHIIITSSQQINCPADSYEENLSESLICEWSEGKNLGQMLDKQKLQILRKQDIGV